MAIFNTMVIVWTLTYRLLTSSILGSRVVLAKAKPSKDIFSVELGNGLNIELVVTA